MLTLDFLHVRRNSLQRLEKNPRLRLYEGGTCGGGMTARQQAIFTLDELATYLLLKGRQANALPARRARGDSGLQGRRDVAVSSK